MAHTILFTEPRTFKNLKPKQGTNGPAFEADPALLEILRAAPTAYVGEDANAYSFGPAFPLSEYEFLGEHGNDAANTGFVDVTLLQERARPKPGRPLPSSTVALIRSARDEMDEVYERNYDYDDRKTLAQLRVHQPWLLWMGLTVGGDVGAALYGHRDAAGALDGLIVDNSYFFDENGRPIRGRVLGRGIRGPPSEREAAEPLPAELGMALTEAMQTRQHAIDVREAVLAIQADPRLRATGAEHLLEDANELVGAAEWMLQRLRSVYKSASAAPPRAETEARAGAAEPACAGKLAELQALARSRGIATRFGGKNLRKADLLAELRRSGIC